MLEASSRRVRSLCRFCAQLLLIMIIRLVSSLRFGPHRRIRKAKCEQLLKSTDDLAMNPLHAATSVGSVECVTALLDFGTAHTFRGLQLAN
jgi:hypothetical protein